MLNLFQVATCNTWGIDGSSRLPVYLNVSNNNRADTILASFLHAVQVFGLPKRVRSDKGGENVLVAEYMIEHQPTVNRPFIAGRSVHNQRFVMSILFITILFSQECFEHSKPIL